MAVTIKVNGGAHSLVHKGSGGVSAATLRDVCKTPTPGGPVPLPYPNVSQSSALKKGSTTVKADGGQMIAIKGSEFSVSNGDNPGTLGGVKSSTFMKESTWISYSFDVKIQGRNACRLTDKKFQNHGNTVDLAGTTQMQIALKAFEAVLCEILKKCDADVNRHYCGGTPTRAQCEQIAANGKPYSAFLGNEKDKCVKQEIQKRQQAGDPAIPPGTTMPDFSTMVPVPGGGRCMPDIMVGAAPHCDAVYDIKTQCPPRGKPSWPRYYYGLKDSDLKLLKGRKAPNAKYHNKTQFHIYKDACGVDPIMIHPYSEDCK